MVHNDFLDLRRVGVRLFEVCLDQHVFAGVVFVFSGVCISAYSRSRGNGAMFASPGCQVVDVDKSAPVIILIVECSLTSTVLTCALESHYGEH